jgi:hypothetical protein
MRVLAALVVSFLLAAASRAATIEGRYVATWAGLPAGEIAMRIDDDGAEHRSRLDIRTEGLPRWLTRFKGTIVSEGRIAPDGNAQPRRYDARYDLRKRKDKLSSLRFVSKAGTLVARRGPGDTSKKPPIAEDFRRGVVDPLSALVAVRHRILAGRLDPGGRFLIPVFDGSRRFDAEGIVARRDGRVHVGLLLKPIAGFGDDRPDEGEDAKSNPREVRIELTDDARLIPIRLEAMIARLPAVVRLAG